MSLLQMKHICKSFSGVYANEDINLTVEKGEIHALLGENGAGKTTLVNIIFGLYTADSGEILWKDKPADFASPREAIDAGIGMVQQHFSLVNKMTVLDNIVLNLKDNSFFLDRAAAKKKLTDLAEKYGLYVNPDAVISDLSVGEQQRVEILKALYRNVELLILDEPTGVLTPQETTQFFDVLRNLKKEGYGIIIITHRMSEIMAISDKVTILRDGRQVADLVTADTNPEELSAYMIGRELNDDYHIEGSPKKDIMLELKNVSFEVSDEKAQKEIIRGINLKIDDNKFVVITGPNGGGKSTLAKLIVGIEKPTSGQILFNGEDITEKSITERAKMGISFAFQQPVRFKGIQVLDLIRMAAGRRMSAADACQYLSEVGLCAKDYINREVNASLSGGELKRIEIATVLARGTQLSVFDEPEAGIDLWSFQNLIQVFEKMYQKIQGNILIISHQERILEIADQLIVIADGTVKEIGSREEVMPKLLGQPVACPTLTGKMEQ